MDYKTIIYEVKNENIGVITLNRPSQYNAINQEMAGEIRTVLNEAENNENIRVLVVTGGGKTFCAGGDLAWLLEADDNLKKRNIMDNAREFITTLNGLKKPVIAAVNGVAAGAGTAVALACDIVIASEKAQFAPNFINIGAVPDTGASWYLPRKVGYHKAMELMLTGKPIEAREAFNLGIYNQLFEEENFEQEAFKMAGKLASAPQKAAQYIKQMLKSSGENNLTTQLEIEASLQIMALSEPDFKEGVNAFLEKRKPNFNKENS